MIHPAITFQLHTSYCAYGPRLVELDQGMCDRVMEVWGHYYDSIMVVICYYIHTEPISSVT